MYEFNMSCIGIFFSFSCNKLYVCMYIYIYMYVCMYVCVYIYMCVYMKSSFPKRYKSILIVFRKMNFFLPRPIHFVNIQFIMLKWSVGSV